MLGENESAVVYSLVYSLFHKRQKVKSEKNELREKWKKKIGIS